MQRNITSFKSASLTSQLKVLLLKGKLLKKEYYRSRDKAL